MWQVNQPLGHGFGTIFLADSDASGGYFNSLFYTLTCQVDQSVHSMAIVPKAEARPLLLVTGMKESAGLEFYKLIEKKVHEPLIKAEFCQYLQVCPTDGALV